MVGVFVAAIQAKGDDDIWPEIIDACGHVVRERHHAHIPQRAIQIIETLDPLDAKLVACQTQFMLADSAQCAAGGGARILNLPCLAARGREDHRLAARGNPARHRSTDAEDLIIWMGEDA
jgi:hypothetical protein